MPIGARSPASSCPVRSRRTASAGLDDAGSGFRICSIRRSTSTSPATRGYRRPAGASRLLRVVPCSSTHARGLGRRGDHSNATIRMFEAGTPSSRMCRRTTGVSAVGTTSQPASPVYTRTTSSVNIDFTGTFDRSRQATRDAPLGTGACSPARCHPWRSPPDRAIRSGRFVGRRRTSHNSCAREH